MPSSSRSSLVAPVLRLPLLTFFFFFGASSLSFCVVGSSILGFLLSGPDIPLLSSEVSNLRLVEVFVGIGYCDEISVVSQLVLE